MYTLIKYIVLGLLQLIMLGDSIPIKYPENRPQEKEDTLCFNTKKTYEHTKLYQGKSDPSPDEAQIPESKIWIVNKTIIF